MLQKMVGICVQQTIDDLAKTNGFVIKDFRRAAEEKAWFTGGLGPG